MTHTKAAPAPLAPSTPLSDGPVRHDSMQMRLYQLADRKLTTSPVEVGRYQPVNPQMVGLDLYKLALETTSRPSLSDEEVLNVFCEKNAVQLLMRLPNLYWFWLTLMNATLLVESSDLGKPLTQHHVAMALAQIRRNYTSKYNLSLDLAVLSQAQVASRTVAGIILVRAGFAELDEIVINPIFAPYPDLGDSLADSAQKLTAAISPPST